MIGKRAESELSSKQREFNAAIHRFNTQPGYTRFSFLISCLNVGLQLVLLGRLFQLHPHPPILLFSFGLAYLLTDFINGMVHLIMDHYDNYSSLAGPLVAQFHLHHQTPVYQKKPPLLVYFHETGAKIWLVAYLVLVWVLMILMTPPVILSATLVFIGVLSSVAEVSHYLCHSSRSALVRILAASGILLSRKHHALHHSSDNQNYAFLNGWSDPLLNRLARRYFSGYKTNTDLHYTTYVPEKLGER